MVQKKTNLEIKKLKIFNDKKKSSLNIDNKLQ